MDNKVQRATGIIMSELTLQSKRQKANHKNGNPCVCESFF